MSLEPVRVGYLPLLDAAPLIIAQELGFAAEERLSLDLIPAVSWSALRDMLTFGRVDAASLLSPIPIASILHLGGIAARIDALMVTSLGGEGIVVSHGLAETMRANGYGFDFADAAGAARALHQAHPRPLRIASPFPFSMHGELLYRWLGEGIEVQTVPPPLMHQEMAAGRIDLFCVGEPWASRTVELGIGDYLLPGTAIWQAPPDKILAMRHEDVEADSPIIGPLMRATWRACRWLAQPQNVLAASEILSRPAWLDVPAEMLERLLSGRVNVASWGAERQARIIEFHAGCATFPWRSQAEWIGAALARRHGLDVAAARLTARAVFRSDLYRRFLAEAGADLPSASSRLEGGVDQPGLHPAASGKVHLLPDQFFDGLIFDPDKP